MITESSSSLLQEISLPFTTFEEKNMLTIKYKVQTQEEYDKMATPPLQPAVWQDYPALSSVQSIGYQKDLWGFPKSLQGPYMRNIRSTTYQ